MSRMNYSGLTYEQRNQIQHAVAQARRAMRKIDQEWDKAINTLRDAELDKVVDQLSAAEGAWDLYLFDLNSLTVEYRWQNRQAESAARFPDWEILTFIGRLAQPINFTTAMFDQMARATVN